MSDEYIVHTGGPALGTTIAMALRLVLNVFVL